MKGLGSILCLATATRVLAGDLTVPKTKPTDAIIVSKDFVGFGIESAFFNSFDNPFSENLVSSLARRMAKAPIIRVGGTSGDYFLFEPNQKADRVCIESEGGCPNSHEAHFLLGPSYFDAYGRFKDAHMSIQAPLGNPVNITNSNAYVWQAWNKLGKGARVASIALGNEVEFIYKAGAQNYIDAALKIQEGIVKNLTLTGDKTKIFEVGNTASGSITNGNYYNVQTILNKNINSNGRVSTTAEHWYQISGDHEWTDDTMQKLMLNHDAITSRFEKYMPSITASRNRNIPYAITEDAAVLGGAPTEFSGGFGYTLWAVDFNLVAMTKGVARVSNLAGRPSAKRVFWVPDNSAGSTNPGPQVRAPYPAAIFLADFIGLNPVSVVKEISTGNNFMSAYAMYGGESNRLLRVAILNLRLYNGDTGKERQREKFQFTVADKVKSARVRRLRADKGVAAMGFDYGGHDSNVTWAGEQWSHGIDNGKGHFPTGATVEKKLEIIDGKVTVVIPDSEAVILFMEY